MLPVQLSELQAIVRGEHCATSVLYLAVALGFLAALGSAFLTWNALVGVLCGAVVYFVTVLAGSANRP